ncbi:ATP-dependent nuclease [Pseudomonas syringae]|uniref:ATP-dependent nuclease n=1 Tax=Pseudomonas syringae TaxID=317 RepID=UPI001011C77C|nr:AAA family ATPase [Pseudomonas syringae]RXT62405.1 chromosome segregation protein SMC [Pseudomonas syringae]
MKISKVIIKNFRSIESAELNLTDFNIFIGQNNTGKTNLFEAIAWFYSGTSLSTDQKFQRNSALDTSVSVEFTGTQHGLENMLNDGNRAKIKGVIGDADLIRITRSSTEPRRRVIEIDGGVRKNPAGFDTALNDFLPKFEYIHTRQYYEELTKYNQKSAVGIMLSSVIEEILSDDPQYRRFRSTFDDLFNAEDSAISGHFKALGNSVKVHLEKQFAECSKVLFEVLSPDFSDLLKKFETVVDDGIETYASEKGDGMQRALMLAIIQAYADYRKAREDAGKSFLFFIDEAELHLHPTAQRKLKEVLLQLSSSLDQVVISTHSSVFVADSNHPETVFKVEKNNARTEIHVTDIADRPYVIYDLLGGSPADLLLPRNFLIVEGPSELELLVRVIKRHYSEMPPIQIISAEGDTHQAKRSINAISKAYSPINNSIYHERIVILCDRPSARAKPGFDQFMEAHSDLRQRGQIKVLPLGSLEECYPEHLGRKTEEEVSRMEGARKKSQARLVGDTITKDEFESGMPLIFEALEHSWRQAF